MPVGTDLNSDKDVFNVGNSLIKELGLCDDCNCIHSFDESESYFKTNNCLQAETNYSILSASHSTDTTVLNVLDFPYNINDKDVPF